MRLLKITLMVSILALPSPLKAQEGKSLNESNILWFQDDGALNAKAQTLIRALSNVEVEGLNHSVYDIDFHDLSPDDYNLREESHRLTKVAQLYIRDLRSGRKAPRDIDKELFVFPIDLDAPALLKKAFDSDDFSKALHNLAPAYPEYKSLRRALKLYREIAEKGGWPLVPEGPSLYPYQQSLHIPALARRLSIQGYKTGSKVDTIYNHDLVGSVQLFQRHHGLEIDGIVGPDTLAALNVPVEKRIDQIVLNMERWRWMPEELGNRHIRVNIAGFELEAYENSKKTLQMPVIVGRPYRRTPVFSSVITNLIFHPSWHVPRSIATLDLLPEIQKDRNYLDRMEFEVLKTDETGRPRVVDPGALDWNDFGRHKFPVTLRQKPGPKNALGHVRFSIRNDFSIYMHGTPAMSLFASIDRARSSGCIRVEKPFDLAIWALEEEKGWPQDRIREVYFAFQDTPDVRPQMVSLTNPLTVHIHYLTAWVDDAGYLNFRSDVYGRDKILAAALFGMHGK